MIKYNYPHFTGKEIEAQIICPVGNTQSQELNTGCLAPRSTVFTKMLYHLPCETQRGSCDFVSGSTRVQAGMHVRVHEVAKSWTQLSDFPFTFHFHALEKEMATHSSVLAWRLPGTGEPGGLPSMGSHRVGHD